MRLMRTLSVAALAMSAGIGAATAAMSLREVTGPIQHLNARSHSLTVKGHAYRYNPNLSAASLHRGETVRIQYRERHGHRYAVTILPAA